MSAARDALAAARTRAAPVARLQGAWERFRSLNPVLVKELRTRMRGARAYWIVFAFLGLLALIVLITYYNYWRSWISEVGGGVGFRASTANVGRAIFAGLFCTQGVLLTFLAPALTAGAVTSEREQRSFELLAATTLTAGAVIRGKLVASLAFLLLLLTAALPMASVSLFFGGVSPGQILTCYLVFCSTAFLYCSIGLFWSASMRRTAGATVGAYVSVLLLFCVSLVPLIWIQPSLSSGEPTVLPFLSLNPVAAAFYSQVAERFFQWGSPSWLNALAFNCVLAIGLLTAAGEQLESFDDRRPAARRLLASLAWLLLWIGVSGAVIGGGFATPLTDPDVARVRFYGAPLFVAVLSSLILISPVLVTSRGREPAGPLSRWSLADFLWPPRWFTDRPCAGTGLLMLWGAIPLGIFALAFALSGGWRVLRAGDILVPAAAVLAGSIVFLGGLGAVCSAFEPRGWRACIAAYIALLALQGLPFAVLVNTQRAPQPGEQRLAAWQVAYLMPTEVLAAIRREPPGPPRKPSKPLQAGFFGGELPDVPSWTEHLWLRDVAPAWSVTAALGGAAGLAGFGVAALVRRRRNHRPGPAPATVDTAED